MAELLESILETLEKFKPIDLDKIEDEEYWKKAITIFSNGKFWKELFKNGNQQLMTLKEFHQKYESTLTAEFLFLDLKRWFKMHSNWEGKGKTDAKLEEELVKMYNLFFMPWVCFIYFLYYGVQGFKTNFNLRKNSGNDENFQLNFC